MIFQRRFHSHTPTSIESPPTPPPKDNVSPAKTLEEILAITVSSRVPKPPPHAPGTVASNPRIVKNIPLRSASSPLKSTVPRRAPSSRKTGHATIHTDPVGGHDAFESDAFAVYMPTTRIPVFDAPVSRPKAGSPTRAQAEAVQTYKEKAEQARKRNNSVGMRIPSNIASYDYAYATAPKADAAIPAILKPSNSPPTPAGVFSVSPPAAQQKWTRSEPKTESASAKSKVSSNTSIYRKPTVLGVTTSAAFLSESVQYVRADAKSGATRRTSPPKSTVVKVSMKSKTPSPDGSPNQPLAVPAIKVTGCKTLSPAHMCNVEHCQGIRYRPSFVEGASRPPSPTKTMPNFARQYSIEGDSIFGYKVKDPLGTVAGADKSASNSDEEKTKPNAKQGGKAGEAKKRTLTDRWPWTRKDGGRDVGIGSPSTAPAPDPPVSTPKKQPRKTPTSVYVSPFGAIATPLTTPPPLRPVPMRHAAATKGMTIQAEAAKKRPVGATSASPIAKHVSPGFDAGIQQMQSLLVLAVKIGLTVYLVVALWFILDALREVLCVLCVPLRFLLYLAWAIVCSMGRVLGIVAGGLGGKIRVLRR